MKKIVGIALGFALFGVVLLEYAERARKAAEKSALVAALEGKLPPQTILLHVGFGETDITPTLGDKPVYMAGFGQNRKAKSIHDPLKARAIVLSDGKVKLAIASI